MTTARFFVRMMGTARHLGLMQKHFMAPKVTFAIAGVYVKPETCVQQWRVEEFHFVNVKRNAGPAADTNAG